MIGIDMFPDRLPLALTGGAASINARAESINGMGSAH
jgi:hypothetical protein